MFDVGGAFFRRGVDAAQDGHGDDLVAVLQPHAPDAGRIPALEHAHIVGLEPDRAAQRRRQQHVVIGRAQADADHAVRAFQLHGDLAGAVHGGEVRQLVAPHVAARSGEHDVVVAPGRLVLGQRQDVHDAVARLDGQQIDEGLAPRLRIAQRQAPGLQLIGLAVGGEEQDRRVGRGAEHAGYGVLVLHRHAAAALAAAMLGPIGVQGDALDVAAVGDGDDHVLARDQVLVLHLAIALPDQGATRNSEPILHVDQVVANDGQDVLAVRQDGQMALDGVGQAVRLAEDVVAAQAGQTRQGQGQDGAGLFVGQADLIALDDDGARIGDQLDQGHHVADGPGLGLQTLARLGRIGRGADDVDHLVDIGDGDGQTDQDVATVAGLVQLELDAANDDFLAEIEEDLQ